MPKIGLLSIRIMRQSQLSGHVMSSVSQVGSLPDIQCCYAVKPQLKERNKRRLTIIICGGKHAHQEIMVSIEVLILLLICYSYLFFTYIYCGPIYVNAITQSLK